MEVCRGYRHDETFQKVGSNKSCPCNLGAATNIFCIAIVLIKTIKRLPLRYQTLFWTSIKPQGFVSLLDGWFVCFLA